MEADSLAKPENDIIDEGCKDYVVALLLKKLVIGGALMKTYQAHGDGASSTSNTQRKLARSSLADLTDKRVLDIIGNEGHFLVAFLEGCRYSNRHRLC
ncbi:MAG: hypothetical protein MZV70_63755 [Desulfobacterales bacterium]|nr:hypothetical protein [Desulfobacterales bacterium]